MKIPYRFLQRSISHRQRNMLKIDNKNDDNDNDDGDNNHNDNDTIESLMSLETFDHLLYWNMNKLINYIEFEYIWILRTFNRI